MIDFSKPKKLNKKIFSKEKNEIFREEAEEINENIKAKNSVWIKEDYSEAIKEAENKISEASEDGAEKTAAQSKIDIKRYKDPEGLSVKKMEIGLWYIKNHKLILKVIIALVILVNFIIWPQFLFSLGDYIIFGIREDRRTMNGITSSTLFDHNYILSISPEPIEVTEVKILELPDNKYDIYALIRNSSEKHFAHFDYSFLVNNKKISSSSNFILPGEAKYLLALQNSGTLSGANPALDITKTQWSRINNHKYPDWKKFVDERIDFIFDDKNFIPAQTSVLTEKVSLNELNFKVLNNTDYNYWDVRLVILISGRNGVAGINQYDLKKVMSGDMQKVSVVWPGRFSRIQDIAVIPEIDVSRDDIYIDF